MKTSFDWPIGAADKLRSTRLAADASGNIYCYTSGNTDEKSGPAVYVFGESGSFRERVVLSKRFLPRQMEITAGKSWVFFGYRSKAEPSGQAQAPGGVLYEFRPNGQFIREIVLRGEEGDVAAANPDESSEPAMRSMPVDLALLLVDRAGEFLMVIPGDRPKALRFDSSGRVTARRELEKVRGMYPLRAAVDDPGRYVLDFMKVTMAGKAADNERRPRILMVLDTATLESQLQGQYMEKDGFLFAAQGGEYFFLRRSASAQLEITRARLR